jgi:tRNA(Ile)-lysidine synthetase-like protein
VKGLEEEVHASFLEAGIPAGTGVLAAVSGGPDSMALLLCLAVQRSRMGITLAACIVDHGIRSREEIDGDIALVNAVCRRLDVPLQVKSVRQGECVALARARRRSLEETARELRHGLLRDWARESGAGAIALGHTQDDVVETLLMRILQGSDSEGLAGIPLRRGMLVRPLIRCSRQRVVEYLTAKGELWRTDPTNQELSFYRNRVRHLLVPVLRKEFPGHRAGLLALAEKQAMTGTLVRILADQLPWSPESQGFSIPAAAFFAAAPVVRARSLLDLYDRFKDRKAPRRLPWRFLAPALVERAPRAVSCILRGYGVLLSRHSGRLFWGTDIASRCKKGYFIEVAEAGTIAVLGAGMSLSVACCPETAIDGQGGIILRTSALDPPLVLRSRRKGDRILLENGLASVNDLIAGWKVPAEARDAVPILADRKGVLAVLGSALGYATRARAGVPTGDLGGADRIVVRLEKA